jgi:hypothetical protein
MGVGAVTCGTHCVVNGYICDVSSHIYYRSHKIFLICGQRIAHAWHHFMFPTIIKIVWGSHFEFVQVFYAIYSTLGKMSAFDQKYVRNGN